MVEITIQEAIETCLGIVSLCEYEKRDRECAKRHAQLAKWLSGITVVIWLDIIACLYYAE